MDSLNVIIAARRTHDTYFTYLSRPVTRPCVTLSDWLAAREHFTAEVKSESLDIAHLPTSTGTGIPRASRCLAQSHS